MRKFGSIMLDCLTGWVGKSEGSSLLERVTSVRSTRLAQPKYCDPIARLGWHGNTKNTVRGMMLLIILAGIVGCATPSVYQCDHPYATAWRFDTDVGRFCRSVCDPAQGAAESSDFDVYATQLVRYDCWPIVREYDND